MGTAAVEAAAGLVGGFLGWDRGWVGTKGVVVAEAVTADQVDGVPLWVCSVLS